MTTVSLQPRNFFENPETVTVDASLTLPFVTRFYVNLKPDAPGYTVTLGSQTTHWLANTGSFDCDIASVGNPPATLAPGDVILASWVFQTSSHGLAPINGASVVLPISYVDTLPADNAPPGLWSVQTGADRGLYMSHGVGPLFVLTLYDQDGTFPV